LAATGGEAPGFMGTDGLGPETKRNSELKLHRYPASRFQKINFLLVVFILEQKQAMISNVVCQK
jgi:hypothetical protein